MLLELGCSAACGVFSDQGSNVCLLHWQVDSLPLSHQGSPSEPIRVYLFTDMVVVQSPSLVWLYFPEFVQVHVQWIGIPSNHLILCCPLLLLPSIFPSIRDFSSESALHIRWPKYWSFSFSISPSNEYPRLISFRIDYIPHKPVRSQISHITSQMMFPLKAKFQLGNDLILKT